jgi:hypothetical protein
VALPAKPTPVKPDRNVVLSWELTNSGRRTAQDVDFSVRVPRDGSLAYRLGTARSTPYRERRLDGSHPRRVVAWNGLDIPAGETFKFSLTVRGALEG